MHRAKYGHGLKRAIIAIGSTAFLAGPTAFARDLWWFTNGNKTALWTDGKNWSPQSGWPYNDHTPHGNDDVSISRNAAPTLTYDRTTALVLRNLYLNDGTRLLDNQGSLTVQNEYINSGNLSVAQAPGATVFHTVGSGAGDGILEIAANNGTAVGQLYGGATLNVWGTEYIGHDAGPGSFDQASGAHTITGVAGLLSIGWDANSGDFYLHGSGVLNAATEIVGNGTGGGAGTGTFTQEGGSNSISGMLTIGGAIDGTYELSGGSLTANTEYIGSNAATVFGTFNQSGSSTHTVNSILTVSLGTYTLSSGTLNAAGELVRSEFNQQGGTHTVTGPIGVVALEVAGSGGNFTLSGGTLTVTNGEMIDGGAIFTQNQNSANSLHTVDTLTVGNPGESSNQFKLDAGTLKAVDVTIAGGTIQQSGGTATLTGSLSVSAGQAYNLSGGSLTAPSVTLYDATGTLHVSGSGVAHLISVDGTGHLQIDPGGKVLYDTAGASNSLNGTVDNSGTVALVSGSDLAFGGLVTNKSGGVFDLQINAGLTGGSGSFNNNSGAVFQKSGGGGISTVAAVFGNGGLAHAMMGTIDFQSGGSSAGEFKSDQNAAIRLGGDWTLAQGTQFTGTGATVLHGGTFTQTGGVVSYDGVTLAADATLQGRPFEFQSNGSFDYAGTVTNTLHAMPGSTLTIEPGAVLDTGTLINEGQATQPQDGGDFSIQNGATIENKGAYKLVDGANISGYGYAQNTFHNNATGTLIKTGDPGSTAQISGVFVNNDGEIDVQSGTLHLCDGGQGSPSALWSASGSGAILAFWTGNWTLNGGWIAGGGLVDLYTDVYVNGTVNNTGNCQLDSTLHGPGTLQNNGTFTWLGTVASDATVTNYGTVHVQGGSLGGTFTNYGTVDYLGSQTAFNPTGNSVVTNYGTWNLNGDVDISGNQGPNNPDLFTNHGTLTKSAGDISHVYCYLDNASDGTVSATSGQLLLHGGQSEGKFVANGGSIDFLGNWTLNSGTQLTGANTYQFGGTTTVMGNTTATAPVQVWAGTLNVAGGTFTVASLENDWVTNVSGGTLSGTILNNYVFNYSGGLIQGSVDNHGTFVVTSPASLIEGDFTNESDGTIKTWYTSLTVTGNFVNDGIYNSDPADNHFNNLIVSRTGTLVGGKGDRFFVTGNLISSSANNTGWNTAAASLILTGGKIHILSVTGQDLGAVAAGYENNFAWGSLMLGLTDGLTLQDGNDQPGGALYIENLFLPGGTDEISQIIGNGLNIYYDPTQPDNAYLADGTYPLTDGGYLLPDPADPAAIASTFEASANIASASAVPLPSQAIPGGVALALIGGVLLRRKRACRP